ncbi:MAG: transposase [Elainellaceae cyanobacterium]
MPNYRRLFVPGSTYFITQVTYQRYHWLCRDRARAALRAAITQVRKNHPFQIEAFVLLPDHFHCLWTLPEGDSDFSTRMRLVKTYVTRHHSHEIGLDLGISLSRRKRKEQNLWQRRFWEHRVRDEADLVRCCDYIHRNPVKHGFCAEPTDWRFSSVHRWIARGDFGDWGGN